MRLGIDFGTTRTVVAACDRGNYPVVGFYTALGDCLDWYPSVVAVGDGCWVFGADAFARMHEPDWAVLRSFKRLLTGPSPSTHAPVTIGDTEIGLLDLLVEFLRALKRDICSRSNLPTPPRPNEPMEAVIATPANAHNTQRFITMEAFRRAGFEVLAVLNEPSAAGVEYAHRYRRSLTSKREKVLVYDLGGGTFDASLVKMRGKSHDVLATCGVSRLGGDDFDRCLLDLALAELRVEAASLPARAVARLLEHCREQKERLHPNSRKVAVEIGACLHREEREALGGISVDDSATIATSDYYRACAPLVERSLETTRLVTASHPEPPPGGDGDLEGVAGVYVVGGASSLPVVARTLRDRYGRRVHRSAYPSAATAIGLAIAGDERAGFEVTERLARNFGVFREAHDGAEVAFDPIFFSGMVLPAASGEPTVLTRTYRAKHNIGHFRYIECGWLDEGGAPCGDITPFAEVLFPFDPALRGESDLRQVPVTRAGSEGALIQERYAVDAAGVAELTIADLDTGYECRHRLGG
jgi:molecular chaperone DnaK (HSP70)